jgi:hypothetical protein
MIFSVAEIRGFSDNSSNRGLPPAAIKGVGVFRMSSYLEDSFY